MADKSKANSPALHRRSFGAIARIMGWAPFDFVGFEGGFFPTPRLPVLLVYGQKNVVEACKGLNYHLSGHPLSPRFGWLPSSAFASHERLSIGVSIREAQRGELPGDEAGNVHWVARQAVTLGESLSQTGKPFYVFFRFFPNVHGPLPLERFVVLPDEEIGTAIEAEAQRWAAKNEKLITERLRKLKAQCARRTGGPPHPRREPSISLDDVIRESDEAFSEAMKIVDPNEHGEQPKANEFSDAATTADGKGVAPRNAWFLAQYEARGKDTYHKPKVIQDNWWNMTDGQRAAICPDAPAKVSHAAVARAISRARVKRDGQPAIRKAQRKPRQRRARQKA